jgi:penicillin-binding protein 1A
MTVLSAIRHSVNTVAVKVALDAGIPTVIQYAKRLGITTPLDPYPTIALGTSAVRPIELASAYSVFANDGRRAHPTAIIRVEDRKRDEIITNGPEFEETRLRPETLEAMNTALRAVVTSGTGTAAAAVPNACGKTGTTSNNIDAWFAGYTPELVTVIWVAHESRGRNGSVSYQRMPGATGGHLCAPIWRDFMLRAVPRQQVANRATAAPEAKEVDRLKPKPVGEVDQADGDNAPPGRAPLDDHGGADASTGDTGDTVQPNTMDTDAPAAGLGANITPAVQAPTPRTSPRAAPAAHSGQSDGRIVEPTVPRSDPGDEILTVRLCAETMRRATEWCPATIERRMRRREIPGSCREHRPPPGE